MGMLGITVEPSDEADVRGLVVTGVDQEGPSAEHLANPDNGGPDVIQSVEGKPVTTVAELRSVLRSAGKGSIVELRVYNAPSKTHRVERVRLTE